MKRTKLTLTLVLGLAAGVGAGNAGAQQMPSMDMSWGIRTQIMA